MKALFITLLTGLLSTGAIAKPATAPDTMHILPVDNRCSLSAGNPVIDYGTQSRWQLEERKGGQQVSPGKRTATLSVVCPYTRAMTLTLRGDQASSGALRYGTQGSLVLRLADASLDGQSVQLVRTTAEGVIKGTPAATLDLKPGNSFTVTSNQQQGRGKQLTIRFEMEPLLPESAARVSTLQQSEAVLTLELTP